MEPVKVNLYISCAPADKPDMEKLLEWLYPMQDEVNIWFYEEPPGPEPLALPWQLLLFWYRPPDQRADYAKVMQQRLERAHIYLFITSHKSILDSSVGYEITRAVQRYIEIGDRFLRIYPVIFRPSNWKEKSRLAHFKQLGQARPILSVKPTEEAFVALSNELQKVVAELQRNLNEQRQAAGAALQLGAGSGNYSSAPDLGDDLEGIEFESVARPQPPEFLGWLILVALFIYVLYSLRPELPSRATRRLRNIAPPTTQPIEFKRENPLMPPAEDAVFPPARDTQPPGKPKPSNSFKPRI